DAGQTFVDAPSAVKYLTEQHREAYKADLDEGGRTRVRELGKAAASTDKIVETTLKPALAYIHDGTALHPAIYEREPWKSPARDPSPAWNFELTHAAPTPLF